MRDLDMIGLPEARGARPTGVGAQFGRFCMVGAAGFVVDTTTLYALIALGVEAGPARGGSFACAVAFTWLLNRRLTFSPPQHGSMAREVLQYLASMSLGALLNLTVYALVLRYSHAGVMAPALGVAAGSVVGLGVNFLSARWWVFAAAGTSTLVRTQERHAYRGDGLALAALMLLFAAGAASHLDLPGLYMDAVNPEYLAARILNPELANPVFAMPTATVPLLGNLYHGVQNLYVSLPFLAALGFSVPVLRLSQAVFGAGIVLMAYMVLRRVALPRSAAFLAAAAMATDLALVASFRTQFHIVLAGTFWLLCAICWALPARHDMSAFGRFRPFASGLAFGLAVYAYFVYLFFLPIWVLAARRRLVGSPVLHSWMAGFLVGLLPYALGYLSMAISLGGVGPTLQWIEQTARGLAPMSSSLSVLDAAGNVLRNVIYAATNAGNELMIFGAALPQTWWHSTKLVLLPALLLVALLTGPVGRGQASPAVTGDGLIRPVHVAWMPVCFLLVALPLGNRLWIHHFSILVPLLYLCAGLAVAFTPRLAKSQVLAGLAALTVLVNLHQQGAFFARLEQTGGAGKMSNALGLLAEESLRAPAGTVHVFTEWGFLMPFNLMTANKSAYRVDLSSSTLQALAQQGAELRIPIWKAADQSSYEARLNSLGWKVHETRPYLQRDRAEAFRVLLARPCGQTPCPP